ncbi:Uma2 family endonuclease [Streptosporangium carneum]|uniref:Putative restriction endonuclease domain-containing protein n=1 Tax=Streptosporangium carneum TaxID=47481 RepID=A0A9W6I227_9ACTN|nr:Uma2 family endonuclease [Streptosporangium carneum]GLK10267.1 hypothetical protein GCM10017600_36730 [Streptosporangium carneum]
MVTTSGPDRRDTGTAGRKAPVTLREFVDRLPETPHFRVEVVNGRVIVSPLSSPRHSWIVALLVEAFLPAARTRGWRVWPGLEVCASWSGEPLVPDFAVGPRDAPRWGEREVLSDGLVLVAEVVSAAGAREDREDKPHVYARGGVPLLLVVDPETEPGSVTLHGDLAYGRYQTVTTVEMGDKLLIPPPIDVTLDTAILLDA